MSNSARSYSIRVAAATNVGLVRNENQDCVGANGNILQEAAGDFTVVVSAIDSSKAVLIADGVGGGRGGAVASEIAVRAFLSRCREINHLNAIASMVSEVSEAVRISCSQSSNTRGGATTLAGIVLAPEFLAIFNVGDSRIYALRANALEMISVDHVEPTDRRTLERFIGGDGLHCLPAVRSIQFDPGTRILLCTDGLNDAVDDDRIKELMEQSDAMFAARGLIAACLERGAPDNVSVAICDFIALH